MRESNGRFLRAAQAHDVMLSSSDVRIDGIRVLSRGEGNSYVTNFGQNVDDNGLVQGELSQIATEKLSKIANLLNQGRVIEAYLFASFTDSGIITAADELVRKAGFDPAEPRDETGKWSKSQSQPDLPYEFDVQYRGGYHDQLLQDILRGFRSQGSIVLENVKITGLNGMGTIPDGAIKPKGTSAYFLEVKTGFDPPPTAQQKALYPLICLGGHAVSVDPRITQLGFTPGVPLPPIDIWFIAKGGPKDKTFLFNYCDVIGIRSKFHAP